MITLSELKQALENKDYDEDLFWKVVKGVFRSGFKKPKWYDPYSHRVENAYEDSRTYVYRRDNEKNLYVHIGRHKLEKGDKFFIEISEV